jgi:hypothetical protein
LVCLTMYSSLFRRLGKSDTLIVLGTTVGCVCVCLTDLLLSAVGGVTLVFGWIWSFFPWGEIGAGKAAG